MNQKPENYNIPKAVGSWASDSDIKLNSETEVLQSRYPRSGNNRTY